MTLDCVAPIKSIRARRCPQHNHCLELHFQHSSETMYVPESMMVLFNWMIMECVGASCRISTCGDCDVDIDSIELSQSAPHCKIQKYHLSFNTPLEQTSSALPRRFKPCFPSVYGKSFHICPEHFTSPTHSNIVPAVNSCQPFVQLFMITRQHKCWWCVYYLDELIIDQRMLPSSYISSQMYIPMTIRFNQLLFLWTTFA